MKKNSNSTNKDKNLKEEVKVNQTSQNIEDLISEIEHLKSKITENEDKVQELETRYVRVLADYHNSEKRLQTEREKIVLYANEILLAKILEILEDLEQALIHSKDDGLEKIVQKFRNILRENGVEEIDAKGHHFDPNLHEAIESTAGDEGLIIKVHRKGYTLNDKVIRPSLVAVGNGLNS